MPNLPRNSVAMRLAVALSIALAVPAAMLYQPQKGDLRLTSTAFRDGGPIPVLHTCDSKDVSPPLQWSGVPPETKSFVLIADDSDARTVWVHWVIYDLPSNLTRLAEDTPKTPSLAGNAKQGTNDFNRIGYSGPCPPPGKAHRYHFRLYALDTRLELKPGATKKEVETAMAGHVIARTQLAGTYERR